MRENSLRSGEHSAKNARSHRENPRFVGRRLGNATQKAPMWGMQTQMRLPHDTLGLIWTVWVIIRFEQTRWSPGGEGQRITPHEPLTGPPGIRGLYLTKTRPQTLRLRHCMHSHSRSEKAGSTPVMLHSGEHPSVQSLSRSPYPCLTLALALSQGHNQCAALRHAPVGSKIETMVVTAVMHLVQRTAIKGGERVQVHQSVARLHGGTQLTPGATARQLASTWAHGRPPEPPPTLTYASSPSNRSLKTWMK
jgi:hypothetical protein